MGDQQPGEPVGRLDEHPATIQVKNTIRNLREGLHSKYVNRISLHR